MFCPQLGEPDDAIDGCIGSFKAPPRKSPAPRPTALPSLVLVDNATFFLTQPLEKRPCLSPPSLSVPFSGWLLFNLADIVQRYTVCDSYSSRLTAFSLHLHTN